MAQPTTTTAQAIWTGIVRFQRKGRMSTVLGGLQAGKASRELTFTEGLALHIIATIGEANVKELADILRLERSWVSRLVSSLERKRAIQSFPIEHDRRAKGVRISSNGVRLLRSLNEHRGSLMTQLLAPLTRNEQRELRDGLHLLANGLGAPAYPAAFDPHPVDFELARLSWCIGVVGSDFMGTGLNVTQYHLAMALDETSTIGPVSLSDLHHRLPIDMSTLSRAIDGFVEAGVIEKSRAPHDRRSFTLQLSDHGKEWFDSLVSVAVRRCKRATRGMKADQAQRLATLLERLTEEIPQRSRTNAVTSGELRLQPASTGKLASHALRILDTVRSDHASGEESTTNTITRYLLTKGQATLGALEIRRNETPGKGQSILLSAEGASPEECVEAVARALALR